MTRPVQIALATALCVLAARPAAAVEDYCVDNPAVLYCNDFEDGSLDGMDDVQADTRIVSVDDAGAQVRGGTRALQSDLDTDADGASFGVRFDGVPRVYVRFTVRFAPEWDRVMHHFFAIHGDGVDDAWSCHGTAGCRPDGYQCLDGTTVDHREATPGEFPGEPFFYAYTPDMTCDSAASCDNYSDSAEICSGCAARGLGCDDGPECCWGNHYDPNQCVDLSMSQDTWYTLETMVAANTPGEADGEMTHWVDGVEVMHHTGILWRYEETLLVNHFIVWNYFPEAERAYRIWFDDLVISTEPIGTPGGGAGDSDSDVDGDTDADADGDADADSDADADAEPERSGGCGCNAPSTSPAALALVFALGMGRRRRSPISTSRGR